MDDNSAYVCTNIAYVCTNIAGISPTDYSAANRFLDTAGLRGVRVRIGPPPSILEHKGRLTFNPETLSIGLYVHRDDLPKLEHVETNGMTLDKVVARLNELLKIHG